MSTRMRRRITTAKRQEIEKEQRLLDSTIVRPFETLQGLPISYSAPPGQYEDILKNPLTVKDSAVLYNALLRSRETIVHHAPMFKLHWVRQTAYAKKLEHMDKEKQKEILDDRENKRRFTKATSNSLEAHVRQAVLTPDINARDVMLKLCESIMTIGPHLADIRIYIAKDARSDKTKRGEPLAPGPGDQTRCLKRAFSMLPPVETEGGKSEAGQESEELKKEPEESGKESIAPGNSDEKDTHGPGQSASPSNSVNSKHESVSGPDSKESLSDTETHSNSDRASEFVDRSGSVDGPGSDELKMEVDSDLKEQEGGSALERGPESRDQLDTGKDIEREGNRECKMDERDDDESKMDVEEKVDAEKLDAEESNIDAGDMNNEESESDEEASDKSKIEDEETTDEEAGDKSEIEDEETKDGQEMDVDHESRDVSAEAEPVATESIQVTDSEIDNQESLHEHTRDLRESTANAIESQEPAYGDNVEEGENNVEVEGDNVEEVEAEQLKDVKQERAEKVADGGNGEEDGKENIAEDGASAQPKLDCEKPELAESSAKIQDGDGNVKKEDDAESNAEDVDNKPEEEEYQPPKRKRGRPRGKLRPVVTVLNEPEEEPTGPRRLSRLREGASKPPPPLPSPSPSPPRRRGKRRGRPPRNPRPETSEEEEEEEYEEIEPVPEPPKIKRGRGRPRKYPKVEDESAKAKEQKAAKDGVGRAAKEDAEWNATESGSADDTAENEAAAPAAPKKGVAQPQAPPPAANLQSIDNVIMISNLNTIAETDASLNGLMKGVALGQAPEEEVNRFKGYIEQARRMGPQPHHAELYYKHKLPLPSNFPQAYAVRPPFEPAPPRPRPSNAPKLTAFQERYLYNATLVIEFHENANVRYIIPQDLICEVLAPEKPPPEDAEEGQEFHDVLFSHIWVHNMDEVARYEKALEEYDLEMERYKKEQEERRRWAEENERLAAEGLPLLDEPVLTEPRVSRARKKKKDDAPRFPADPNLKFTTYSFTLHNIPAKYVPIVVNSVKPVLEVRARMEKILRGGLRVPSYYLWYRIDARLDEQLAESLRSKAVEEEQDMPGLLPPVEPKKRKPLQNKNPKKRVNDESPERPLVPGYPMTARGYTPVLNTGVTGPET